MPVRRVNSTGRVRILREDVQISVLYEADGSLYFECEIDLEGYGLRAGARVMLEAYRQTSLMRFDLGTAETLSALPRESRRLTEFSGAEGLLFRIKVIDRDTQAGMLLAECDRIAAKDAEPTDESRRPLLPPEPGDIGQQIWRVDLSGPAGPRLIVNQRLRDWKATATSWEFRALVYPAAMRQVLLHITLIDKIRDTDDDSDWRCLWLRFAESLPGADSLPDPGDGQDDWEDWVTSAVDTFARLHQLLDRFVQSEEGGRQE